MHNTPTKMNTLNLTVDQHTVVVGYEQARRGIRNVLGVSE